MIRMKLNINLEIVVPEGFHVMDENDARRRTILAGGEGAVLEDPERHAVISIGWKAVGRLALKILSTKNIAGRAERSIRRAMKGYDYYFEEETEPLIGGRKADGFRYTYFAQGVKMAGESDVVKFEQTLYYFHLYTRDALKEENRVTWNEILASAEWIAGGTDAG